MTVKRWIQVALLAVLLAGAASTAHGASMRAYLVSDVWPGPDSSLIEHMAVGAGHLWFVALTDQGTSLWRSDGTAAGTHLVRTFFPTIVGPEEPLEAIPNEITGLGDIVLFTAGDEETGEELWRSDGTFEGTYMVKEIWPGIQWSGPGAYANVVSGLAPLTSTVIFQARDDWFNWEPWVSDGTAAGTLQLAEVVPGPEGTAVQFLSLGDRAVFFVGTQLWATDGTPAGTGIIAELDTASARTPVTTQGSCFFVNGLQIWRTDGTPAGTGAFLDLSSGPNTTLALRRATDSGLFFSRHWWPPANYAYEIWFSDFEGFEPRVVYTYDSDTTTCCDGVFPGGTATSREYFFGGHPASEMWASDGTVAGTRKVVDFAAIGITAMNSMTHMDDLLLFHGTDLAHGEEWWWCDGTAEGTRRLEVRPGPEGAVCSDYKPMDGRFYFSADDGVHGWELWAAARVGVSAVPVGAWTSDESGGSATLSVSLQSKPLRDVVVPVAVGDPGTAHVTPSFLTFTPDSWSTPQEITVTRLAGAPVDGPFAYSIVLGPETSEDPAYDGLEAAIIHLGSGNRTSRPHVQRHATTQVY